MLLGWVSWRPIEGGSGFKLFSFGRNFCSRQTLQLIAQNCLFTWTGIWTVCRTVWPFWDTGICSQHNKTFLTVNILQPNKLEYSTEKKYFDSCLFYTDTNVVHLWGPIIWADSQPCLKRLKWKSLSVSKHSSLSRWCVNDTKKMFYNIDTWAKC